MSIQTTELEIGTLSASLAMLVRKGVQFSTVIDVGCADGTFFLQHTLFGMFPGCVPVNIDANPLYEPSLKALQEIFGGHYFIAAASDHAGEVVLTTSTHPYWTSLRGPDDPYWQRVNRLSGEQVKVRSITLDQIATEYNLTPPYLLKLDVQGAEASVLRGARQVMQQASVIMCEADLDDFHTINRIIDEAGFDLFDITSIGRLPDHSVGWFYPVYINRSLNALRSRSLWHAEENEEVIKAQIERREGLLAWQAEILTKIRAARTS